MSESENIRWRESRDALFASSGQSPLTTAQKAAFDGLAYYDYDETLVFDVTLDAPDDEQAAQIFTTQNTIRNYRRAGRFTVQIDGQAVTLTLFQTDHGFFLPFTDTNPDTYGGGRYIDAAQIDGATFRIDFNRAYHPYCVYNSRYDCPIPPAENRLTVAIRAGEMLPPERWLKAQ
ncbi:MAG: DUF1684 domain-containing protein [Anaerolineaceae bacterium]|nr:MAG: DUF1684 domain-containing protein [Anaerolineaceae bacterium]